MAVDGASKITGGVSAGVSGAGGGGVGGHRQLTRFPSYEQFLALALPWQWHWHWHWHWPLTS
jgi:hypothetical protein